MPSERIAKCFGDVLQAIDLIRTWVGEAGGANQAILHDLKARSAIERQLLVISEAAIRLHKLDPTMAPRMAPNIDWPGVRSIGNFIRHQYDNLEASILIDAVQNRLDELHSACQLARERLQTG